jgi:hypothetical protein
MRRLVSPVVVAVLFFSVGWLIGHAGPGAPNGGFFRLSIEAPTGDSTIKCEGCQFLTWTADGHAGARQPAFNYTCIIGPCRKVVGAVVVTLKPTLIAN